MNFQKVKTVDSAKELLDVAIKRAKKREKELISSKKMKGIDKKIHIEKEKINLIKTSINTKLDSYVQSFPNLDSLSEFYTQIIATIVDTDKLRKALSSVNWASTKISELTADFQRKIKRGIDENKFLFLKKAFYGRISSVVKRIDKHLIFLEEARKILKSLPDINSDLFTICIAGFPNVGKSTLLSKITPSKPKIQNYAFTTKGLNIGYIIHRNRKLQVVDTPGTLARFDKMNNIEKQAYLSIKYEANIVIFIYDLTDTYPLENQEKLFEVISEFDKPILIYFSKSDLISLEKIKEFVKNKKIKEFYIDADKLIQAIINEV